MSVPHYAWRYAVTVAILFTASCNRKPEVDAPPPVTRADVDSLPPLPMSVIEAPLSYDVTPALRDLEKVVPRRFGDIEKKIASPGNKRVHFAFEAQRDPFVIKLDGDTVRMTAVIRYAGRVWYNPPLAPEMSASCGVNGDRPRARVEVVTPIRMSTDWKLRSRTTVRTVEAMTKEERDQCELTFLKLDVTGKVVDAARKLFESKTKWIDNKVATINLREKFEGFWATIQQPIRLTDTVWLAINPKGVHLGRASGAKRTLTAGVVLTAEPRIVVGRKPEVPATPLPTQVAATETPGGFHILFEGVLAYDVASKLLTEQLRGEKISMGRHSIAVDKLRMFSVGGGKIALEVTFGGVTSGHVYFIGTPLYDYAGDRLYVPDLDYDVGTANVLVRGLSWLKHDDLRNYLRDKARWPMGGLIKQAHKEVTNGINRDLSPGVRLSGEVRNIEIAGVHAAPEAVRVRAHADGTVRLDVGQKPDSLKRIDTANQNTESKQRTKAAVGTETAQPR